MSGLNLQSHPIVVTGSHRSGSTWVGKTISSHPFITYVREPLNIEKIRPWLFMPDEKKWYPSELTPHLKAEYERLLSYQLNNSYGFATSLNKWDKIAYLKYRLVFLYSKVRQRTLLLKDPFMLFLVEEFFHCFNSATIVLIRHPAAFVQSILKVGWAFNFDHFLNQPELMENKLSDFRHDIERASKFSLNLADQAILLWNIIHFVIKGYQLNYKDEWYFVTHESLSEDPLVGFTTIFSWLNIPFNSQVKSYIMDTTGSKNPAKTKSITQIKINSRKNIYQWKNQLDSATINHIRRETESIYPYFYTEETWDLNVNY